MRCTSAVLLCLLVGVAGCASEPTIARDEAFAPNAVRIHPTFTQVKDWTGDNIPDGVEAVVELLDSFNEPTRGNGKLLFELWGYRKYDPDPLGKRVGGPWQGSLLTREEQDMHWSPALRAYTFQLAKPNIDVGREFVLTASFETPNGAAAPGGGRLFDRLIIEPPPGKKNEDDAVGKARGGKR